MFQILNSQTGEVVETASSFHEASSVATYMTRKTHVLHTVKPA